MIYLISHNLIFIIQNFANKNRCLLLVRLKDLFQFC